MELKAEKGFRIIIIGDISYPSGAAPSNRVHLYCKALKESNHLPFVINVSSVHKGNQELSFLQRFKGIPFYYCQKNPMYENNFIKRNLRKIKGVFNSFFVILRLIDNKEASVLFYSLNVRYEMVYFIFLKLLNIPIVKEINEAPLFIIENKKFRKVHVWIHKNVMLRMYDRLIVISNYLKNFYSSLLPAKNIFQIPILVDMERFDGPCEKNNNFKKVITYVGFMGGNKDGLDNLIEALGKVKEKENSFKVQLVGNGPEKDIHRLKEQVLLLKLEDHISFLGSRSSSEIPKILSKSDLLVLARPDSNQAKAGFPTKLGEYLASKKPVVITKTGEICNFLEDNKSAYLVDADQPELFAEKIIFALNDVKAATIGLNGYTVATENFNYKLYNQLISKIFTDFSANKLTDA
jgi:glycosyltransferase involved in cell wall biosynthesis